MSPSAVILSHHLISQWRKPRPLLVCLAALRTCRIWLKVFTAWPIAPADLAQELLDLVQQAGHYRQLKKGANEG